jgi:Skp family chaperone for outer membrane proteins
MNKLGTFALALALAGTTVLSAQSKEDKSRAKAKDTVNRVREADPPKVKERPEDDTAQKRADEANAQEKTRQKEVAKKYPAKGKEVPPPK